VTVAGKTSSQHGCRSKLFIKVAWGLYWAEIPGSQRHPVDAPKRIVLHFVYSEDTAAISSSRRSGKT
jgi:hypothetical protein